MQVISDHNFRVIEYISSYMNMLVFSDRNEVVEVARCDNVLLEFVWPGDGNSHQRNTYGVFDCVLNGSHIVVPMISERNELLEQRLQLGGVDVKAGEELVNSSELCYDVS